VGARQRPKLKVRLVLDRRALIALTDIADLPGTTVVGGHEWMLRSLIAICVPRSSAAVSGGLRMRNCRPAIVEPGRVPLLLGLSLRPARDEARG
jgi:hypothetical protein